MPSNSAQQTAQAQQGNQLQAEQFFAQQRQQAENAWANYFAQNPNPAAQWSGIAAPSFAGMPAAIGGGTFGRFGGSSGLKGAFGPWAPTPPGGGYMSAPPSEIAFGNRKGGGNGGSGGSGKDQKPPPSQGGAGGPGGYRGHYGA